MLLAITRAYWLEWVETRGNLRGTNIARVSVEDGGEDTTVKAKEEGGSPEAEQHRGTPGCRLYHTEPLICGIRWWISVNTEEEDV